MGNSVLSIQERDRGGGDELKSQAYELEGRRSVRFMSVDDSVRPGGPGGGVPDGASGKEPTCQCRRPKRRGCNSWVGKIPWRDLPVPFQYPCLEKPRDRGAWWATVHGVTESWT